MTISVFLHTSHHRVSHVNHGPISFRNLLYWLANHILFSSTCTILNEGSGYTKTTYLTMEASEMVVRPNVSETKSLKMTPIANIRAELKLFNAVFSLNRTPLKSLILDPTAYKEPAIPNRIPRFKYTGYVGIKYVFEYQFTPFSKNERKQLVFYLLIFKTGQIEWWTARYFEIHLQ